MRTTLSTQRKLARARATRRPRSSRIVVVAGASLVMGNPTAAAQTANQITNPIMDATVGVQTAGGVANVSISPVTELGPPDSFA